MKILFYLAVISVYIQVVIYYSSVSFYFLEHFQLTCLKGIRICSCLWLHIFTIGDNCVLVELTLLFQKYPG